MATMRRPHLFACRLTWTGGGQGETTSYGGWSRAWRADFEGKPPLEGSAAPAFRGDSARHNPEDLLVAALSACHCLSYLTECARAGIIVESYEDDAEGRLDLVDGKLRFAEVTLRPRVIVASSEDVSRAEALHEPAHRGCFIAGSVNFPVLHEASVRAR